MTAAVGFRLEVTPWGALRAIATDGEPIASAVNLDGEWTLFSYGLKTPCGALTTQSEAVAREWLNYIATLHVEAATASGLKAQIRHLLHKCQDLRWAA